MTKKIDVTKTNNNEGEQAQKTNDMVQETLTLHRTTGLVPASYGRPCDVYGFSILFVPSFQTSTIHKFHGYHYKFIVGNTLLVTLRLRSGQ